jgi:hypothetical protein
MRTFGRVVNPDGSKSWVEVTTDANGFDDAVWITTLCQNFLLNLNESPFDANWGLPAQQSVLQQVQPDYYVAQIQRQFAQYFASLIISKVPDVTTPTYNVAVTTNQGSKIIVQVPT